MKLPIILILLLAPAICKGQDSIANSFLDKVLTIQRSDSFYNNKDSVFSLIALEDSAIKYDTDFYDAYHLKAKMLCHIHEYIAALEVVKKMRTLKYGNHDLLDFEGEIYYKLSDSVNATKVFEELLEMQSKNLDTEISRSGEYIGYQLRVGGVIRYLFLLDRQKEVDSLSKRAYINDVILITYRRKDKIIDSFIKGDNVYILSHSRYSFIDAKNYRHTLTVLKRMLEAYDDPELYNMEGAVYYKLLEYDSSIIAFKKAIKIYDGSLKQYSRVYNEAYQYLLKSESNFAFLIGDKKEGQRFWDELLHNAKAVPIWFLKSYFINPTKNELIDKDIDMGYKAHKSNYKPHPIY